MAESLEDVDFTTPVEQVPLICSICEKGVERVGRHACPRCERRYPPSLIKACQDQPWDYMMKLRTGETLRFEGASIHGEYVTIKMRTDRYFGDPAGRLQERGHTPLPADMERGLDIRVADIVWCADAPDGS